MRVNTASSGSLSRGALSLYNEDHLDWMIMQNRFQQLKRVRELQILNGRRGIGRPAQL